MENKEIKISIIIPSWNTKNLLRNCLKSLGSSYEIIVVDNNSTDGTVKMIEKEFPDVLLIKNKKNLGFGAANNQGLRKAKGDYLLLLNSDTVIKNKAPLVMAQYLKNNNDVGVVGPKLLNKDESLQPSAGPFPNLKISFIMLFLEHWLGDLVRSSFKKTKEVDWVMGAAFMIKREILNKVGFMDEGLFMYMDEVEWSFRIKKAGYKVVFYPQAQITHLGGASSRTGRKDPILNIYRGLIYLYKKHYLEWQLPILKIMLKLKAAISYLLGLILNNSYLKQTYAQAFKIASS